MTVDSNAKRWGNRREQTYYSFFSVFFSFQQPNSACRLLPLEITAEHGAWRKVRDHEGVEGWILVTLLYGPRTALIRGRVRTLCRDDDMSSAALLTAEPGVIGRILTCTDIWCRLKVGDTKAWIEKRHVWGVYNNEILD